MLECVCGGYVAPLGWVGGGREEGEERKKGKVGGGRGGIGRRGGGKVIGGTLHHKCFVKPHQA